MGCATQLSQKPPNDILYEENLEKPVLAKKITPLRVCIIGSAHAGTAAAVTLRNFDKRMKITVFERNNCISFLQCGIHLAIMDNCANIDKMFYNSVDNLKQSGIIVNYLCEVQQIDYGTRTVFYKDLRTDQLLTEEYDKLIISLGSKPQIPRFLRNANNRILWCKNYDDTHKLLALRDSKIAILGAGPIGAELAYAFTVSNSQVYLIDQSSRILQKYFIDFYTDILEEQFEERGCKILLNDEIKDVNCTENGVEIVYGKQRIEVDYVILAAGFAPNNKIVFQSDVLKQMKHTNYVIDVNSKQETSIANVYAAGDCCCIRHNISQSNVYSPLATNAIRQGTIAAYQMLGYEHIQAHGTQGSFGMHIFDYCIACTGLSMEEAAHQQMKNVSKLVLSEQIIRNFQHNDDFIGSITLLYNEESRAILGCQVISSLDLTGFIDVVSLAISANMTVNELGMSEWCYNPRISQFLSLVQQICLVSSIQIPVFLENTDDEGSQQVLSQNQ
ncbi:NADH oxidase [Spironucleus salmonicida]|uniref:NADH oxidase n=1 Tax=Spironucleus salmonicida TaxID=348837 RepID=V6LPJ0_9EUKA|nr:NADH oxidase [Spironucleus salmonicida]|eukprot:EST46592.1 NADH oxidase [Spironucleus salmonicida]